MTLPHHFPPPPASDAATCETVARFVRPPTPQEFGWGMDRGMVIGSVVVVRLGTGARIRKFNTPNGCFQGVN